MDPESPNRGSVSMSRSFQYGAIKRIHSFQGLQGLPADGIPANTLGHSRRSNSFHDLPLVAVAGITTRVSIANVTSASALDLQDLFAASETTADESYINQFDIEAVEIEGGWTAPLVLSATGALLSALAFGINNGNMNTQAQVMRDVMGIPASLDEGCVPPGHSTALPANDVIWGFCVSAFCLSALLGSTVAGQVADRHGRRGFLLGNSLLYVAAAFLEAASGPFTIPGDDGEAKRAQEFCSPKPQTNALCMLLFGRLLTGVACGGSTVAVPMYLGETAPAHLRGTLGSAFLLIVVTGMFFGQIAGLPGTLGTPQYWPLILLLPVIPAALQLFFFQPLLVESPRWLLLHGQPAAAAEALARLRGCSTTDVELIEELELMGDGMGLVNMGMGDGAISSSSTLSSFKHDGSPFDQSLREPMMGSASHDGGTSPSSFLKNLNALGGSGSIAAQSPKHGGSEVWGVLQQAIVTEPAMRKPLCVCVTLMAAQQLSGINNAFNYSSTFFMANGMSEGVVTWIAVAMNLGNVLVVLLSTVLMDRAGRRVLLLSSMGGMVVSIILLSGALLAGCVPLVVVGIVLFVMAFGLGLGPVVWLLPAELFPMSKRAPATAAVTSVNWFANFIVGQSFPLLAGWLGALSFIPFAAVLFAAWLFAYFNVPETRGRTLEDIERQMRAEVGAR